MTFFFIATQSPAEDTVMTLFLLRHSLYVLFTCAAGQMVLLDNLQKERSDVRNGVPVLIKLLLRK